MTAIVVTEDKFSIELRDTFNHMYRCGVEVRTKHISSNALTSLIANLTSIFISYFCRTFYLYYQQGTSEI